MHPRLPHAAACCARLVTGGGPVRRYRPLIAGPALLERPAGAAVWSVAVACDRLLLPRVPRHVAGLERRTRVLAARGGTSRIGIAVVGPLDRPALPGPRPGAAAAPAARPLRLDFYGWALLYQPPGLRGRALVDADDRHADLPAVFELPLELIDRAEHLESRGVRTRPLLVPTLPGDFAAGPDGRPRNRFVPDAPCRAPSRPDGLG